MYSLLDFSNFYFEAVSFQVRVSQDPPYAIFTEAGSPDPLFSQGESKRGNAFSSISFDLNDGQVSKFNPAPGFCILKVPVDGASLFKVPVHKGHARKLINE